MAYSTNADVVKEFKSIDTTNGVISDAKIDEYIAQADAYINGRVGLVYETPVTGTNSLLILKEISIGFVAQRIAFILETKSITPTGDQAIPKNLIEQAESRLTMIAEKTLILDDAEEKSSNGGVSSYTSENNVTRNFQQGVQQW
ncbi:hypothetical protein KAR91_40765 [Candidatus Pacearchaeota archaeon]|nr:hypothetical protein [Candidatus Pacearchaeota archaeon]